jgi:hypothetical protein
MDAEPDSPELIERIGRFFLFRAIIFALTVLYAVRLMLMIKTQADHMSGWRTVLWQGARDGSVVLMLVYWRRYFANYTARRASLLLRRRDAWQLTLVAGIYMSLELPSLLELPWPLAVLISAALGATIYLWEVRIIRGLEGRTK